MPTPTSLEAALVADLDADAGVIAATAAYRGTRSIHFDALPSDAQLPALLLRVSRDRTYSLDGPTSLIDAAVAISCRAATRLAARALADAVAARLDAFTGMLGGALLVVETLHQGEAAGSARAGDGSDLVERWIDLDYLIRYRLPNP